MIRVTSLAHVHYAHPDLDKAICFLQDFGLVVEATVDGKTYLRGYGEQPFVYVAEQSTDGRRHFRGGYWVAESRADLERAAANPAAVSEIEESSAPGGGEVVRLRDPWGFLVGFVHGQRLREAEGPKRLEEKETAANEAVSKNRKGVFRRFQHGASPIHKLGHYGILVPKDQLDAAMRWYYGTMNLKPTDYVVDPETKAVDSVFNHIDLGKEYTDHHSFFISTLHGPKPYIHHSSFEVNDFDTQVLGHDWLQAKGYVNCWGIGRHVLGSQIFDYWFDPSGNIIEHYSDGDLVNEDTPVTEEPAGPNSLYIWGPNIPLAFASGKVEDAHGYQLVSAPDAANGRAAEYVEAKGTV